jgi:hypothetical protein
VLSASKLRALLSQKAETQTLDYKRSFNWNTAPKEAKCELVKDILAFLNTPKGGCIIFGVEDATLTPVGLSQDDFVSFDTTKVNDFLHTYTLPKASCTVQKLELDGLHFVVVNIPESKYAPILCKKGATFNRTILRDGALYVRTEKATSEAASAEESQERSGRTTCNKYRLLASGVALLLCVAATGIWFIRKQRDNQTMGKEISPSALRVTGYTLYQQTVGQPLRVGIHLVNEGDATLLVGGTSSVGVFETKGIPNLELEEKVFRSAEQSFEEKKSTGTLNKLEIPPHAQMHFDVDTAPKFVTQEMLNSISKDEIRVYFAGILGYDNDGVEHVLSYCGFTNSASRSIPNCRRHNGPETPEAETAGSSVNVSEQQFQLDQRPWVSVKEINEHHGDRTTGVGVNFINVGKTPAEKVAIAVYDKVLLPSDPEPVCSNRVETPVRGILQPNQASVVSVEARLPTEDWRTAIEGTKKLYVFGRVDYVDVFRKRHWTTFCYVRAHTLPDEHSLYRSCKRCNETDRAVSNR